MSREDLENYFDAVSVAGAGPYPKLFDMADANFEITDTDMLLVAIVAGSQKGCEQAHLCAVLADADRPLLVFRTVAEAEQWLKSAPGGRPAESRARP